MCLQSNTTQIHKIQVFIDIQIMLSSRTKWERVKCLVGAQ